MCSQAIRLALDLRSTGNEYVWEQTLSSRIDGVEYNAEKDSMVGTEEPDISDDEDLDVSLVVFGGVVRGEKYTGLLKNGVFRISGAHVVVKRRGKNES